MRKVMCIVLIAMFAMTLCVVAHADEYETRAQVITGEINNIEQGITKGQGMIANLNQQITQLQINRTKRLGALEELSRIKEVADRKEALEEKAKLISETAIVEDAAIETQE